MRPRRERPCAKLLLQEIRGTGAQLIQNLECTRVAVAVKEIVSAATVARVLRVPTDTIAAPMFPASLEWLSVATLRMDKQRGRPVLLEFWDFCRPASLRTLPYLKAWHERYAEAGLRVISVHAPGFAPAADEEAVARAVARLGIEHPVLLDTDLVLWKIYDNEGWPARYLFDPELRLFEV